jgi:thioredoxin-like negative regulator of GroEL
MYTAPWCKACKQVEPFLEQAKLRGVQVDKVDVEKNQELAQLENIQSLPTLFFSINGTRTRCVTGASSEAVEAIGLFGGAI